MLVFFKFLGVLFCLFQLIAVQTGIIILNALFNEIIDGIILYNFDKPRQNHFYEYIEISSYKEMPEIDVGMVTSSLGIIVIKNWI